MIASLPDPPATQLVGSMALNDTREFVFLSLTLLAGGQGHLDRPNSFQFNLPLNNVQVARANLRFHAGSLQFDGTFDGQHFGGTVRDGANVGTCELQTLYALPPNDYQALLGHYRLAPDREIMLSLNTPSDGPIYFYGDKEQIVRFYPLNPTDFLSERLETFSFAPAQDGPSTSCWKPYSGPVLPAERIAWCREQRLLIPVEDYHLAGTLLLPQTEGPHPLVIFCHLADTHTRDYYRLFAEPFVERGIAAFIYDKRGSGESTGTQLFSQIFPLADDATAVFRFLQKHSAIKQDQIGLWGISNGAWVAPLAAERVGNAAFVIAAACSGVPPARQEQLRRANVARELGASPRAVDLISRLWHSLFDFYINGEWNAEVELLLQQVSEDEELQNLPKHPHHAPNLQPVPPLRPIEQIRAQGAGTWKEGGFEVAEVFAKLRCPILCVWGENDSVLPVDESQQRIEQALQESSHPSYQLSIIPQATHNLYVLPPPVSGILSEVMYNQMHNVAFAPGTRQLMVEWAAQHLAL